ncbi:hypothetical protein Goari_006387 [Gossypium aridum]|uniref:Putative plant transposon protein domain-containing protein n=1 Tax=Gossypium aridum TaxID=34290 RepID=A0A7J8XNZ9_GOSAI|nr:hypothetical protein [Gossypium aridum]
MWDMVLVRGKEVRVTPYIICDFYNAPYYKNDFIDETDLEYFRDIDLDSINFLTKGSGEWKYRTCINIPVSFHQGVMFLEAKMWTQFVCTKIVLALNVSNVNTFRAVLLYAILQKKQVCIGKWIHQNMRRCVGSQKPINEYQVEEAHESEEEGEDEKNDGSEEIEEEDD